MHLQTELMIGIIAAAAVEKILVGEAFADVAGLVVRLDDLDNLVGLPIFSSHQSIVDEVLQASSIWGAGAIVRDVSPSNETILKTCVDITNII